MYDRKVKRLPVVDQGGRLVGIISRTDILAVFDRTDAEIREEIMTRVIAGRSEPSQYSVIVTDGLVTLEGNPETVAIGHALVAQTRQVLDGYAKAGGHYTETVIADSGHGPHLDQPGEFGAALLAHLVNAAAV